MPRALGKVAARARRKKFIKRAKGFWGKRKNRYRAARETVARAERFSGRDRKQKKREMRSLWIIRVNAAARENGITYGQLIHGLNQARVTVDRKILADLALNDPAGFKAFAELAKKSVAAKA